MKKKIIFLFALIPILVVGYFPLSSYLSDLRLKQNGNELVAKVESFRETHKRLPTDLSEIEGANIDGPLYYQRKKDDEYVIWYGKGLGESVYYNSKRKSWDIGG